MLDRMKAEEAPRKPAYEKPELTVVEFTADEVMAVGCKSGPATNRKPGAGCAVSLPRCRTNGS